jgi:isopentenyl-diphosphate Delta-isomerase
MVKEQVILVDENDVQTGIMDKMEAHQKALLHRAISVFIFNTKGEWLLQRRALSKYHSGGLWTNTCCSHPFPGESNIDAAIRRLKEEMGLKGTLKELFSFTYKEQLDHGLAENEFDHVFYGIIDEQPLLNYEEVMEWKYVRYFNLYKDINDNPDNYTVWFKKIFERVHQYISKQ